MIIPPLCSLNFSGLTLVSSSGKVSSSNSIWRFGPGLPGNLANEESQIYKEKTKISSSRKAVAGKPGDNFCCSSNQEEKQEREEFDSNSLVRYQASKKAPSVFRWNRRRWKKMEPSFTTFVLSRVIFILLLLLVLLAVSLEGELTGNGALPGGRRLGWMDVLPMAEQRRGKKVDFVSLCGAKLTSASAACVMMMHLHEPHWHLLTLA